MENMGNQFQKEMLPPQSTDAEYAVLGGILNDPDKLQDICKLAPMHFYLGENAEIFAAILEVADKTAVDALTVKDYLQGKGRLEAVGGEEILCKMVSSVPTATNVVKYAEIIIEKFVMRKLIASCTSVVKFVQEQGVSHSMAELLDHAETSIMNVGDFVERNKKSIKMADVHTSAFDGIYARHIDQEDNSCLNYGIEALDDVVDISPGDLIVIAGRPGMGKTTLGMNIATNLSKKGLVGAVFSLEMPAEQIVERNIAAQASVNMRALRKQRLNSAQWASVASSYYDVKEMPLYVDDTAGVNVRHIKATARRIKKEAGRLDYILIDYLQLMGADSAQAKGRPDQVIAEITKSLKALGKELTAPVVLLSQLNRSLENREDKRPVMSDLRESGAIEQDADVIIFTYRDSVYSKKKEDSKKGELIVAKFRGGAPGTAQVGFEGEFVRFTEPLPEKEKPVLKVA